MIERDYILRMIQQLTSVLAKVLFHQNLGEYEDAQHEIDDAGEKFLGAKWSFLRTLTDQQLIQLLGYEQHPDKMLATGELLRQESDLLEAQGKMEEGINQAVKAFSLFAELIIRQRDYLSLITEAKIDRLLGRLEEYELPVSIQEKQFRYHEITKRYSQADASLHELLERDKRFVTDGRKFYERLLTRSDEELQQGNLSRQEVKNKLVQLESKGT
jgi:hypothetical protein